MNFEHLERRDLLTAETFSFQHAQVPNYVMEADAETIADGAWSDPSTWLDGRVPDEGDRIAISHRVDYRNVSDTRYAAINVYETGVLAFASDVDTKLVVGTLTSLGSFEIGTPDDPIDDHATAELVIADTEIDTNFDPEQFGNGVLILGSRFVTRGTDRGSRKVQIAAQTSPCHTIVELSEPVSTWRVGDEVFFPGNTIHQAEYGRIASISDDGMAITLENPLLFPHGTSENTSHIANLSSNIVFRSENPQGTRGHVMATGNVDLDVHDAVFRDFGRTTVDLLDNAGPDGPGLNQIGRYSFHMHHIHGGGSGYQYQFAGNVIVHGEKWGLAIHDTHYGLVEHNAMVDIAGAGIVFEDGSETGNVVRNNFTGLHVGSGESPFDRNFEAGHEGVGIWARGPQNYILDNVVANAEYAGIFFWSRFGDGLTDMTPLEFRGNVAYGSKIGLSLFGAGQTTQDPYAIVDFEAWGVETGVRSSYSGTLEFSGLTLQGDGRGVGVNADAAYGVNGEEWNVTGFRDGVQAAGAEFGLQNAHFDNDGVDVHVQYQRPEMTNSESHVPKPVFLSNLTFGDRSRNRISHSWDPRFYRMGYTFQRDVYVIGFNGVEDDSFQLFAHEQRPNFVMEYSGMGSEAVGSQKLSPVAGQTNEQLWSEYRIAPLGRVAPSSAASRDKIGGLVAPIPDDIVGPSVYDVASEEITPGTVQISWKTNEPATSQVEWSKAKLAKGSYGNLTQVNDDLTTDHAVTISGLDDGSYSFLVHSHDGFGNYSGHEFGVGDKSYNARWFGVGDAAPKITSKNVTRTTRDTVSIWLAANVPVRAEIYIRKPGSAWRRALVGEDFDTRQTIVVDGLEPGTTYEVKIKASSEDGTNAKGAGVQSFTTANE